MKKNSKGTSEENTQLMAAFSSYVDELRDLIFELPDLDRQSRQKRINEALDTRPSEVLRNLVSIEDRRSVGAFFTPVKIADRLAKLTLPRLKAGAIIIDPACGVGNLLAACSYYLPVGQNFEKTIKAWGNRIYGMDLYPEFVKAAKARLLLVAAKRGMRSDRVTKSFNGFFPNIRMGDGLNDLRDFPGAPVIVLNPPFGKTESSYFNCAWANGKVSTAAIFVSKLVSKASEGTEIFAILPDVLRSGSLYSRWRFFVESHSQVKSVEPIGQFDRWTDIDVFILRLVVTRGNAEWRKSEKEWWPFESNSIESRKCIGDLFEVHVGPLVPHRDPYRGKWYPYIYPRLLRPWHSENIDDGFIRRRFSGKIYQPPFVVVRRTSRPDDEFRSIATLILGQTPVAVENHLIILKPYSNKLRDCENLVNVLHTKEANNWLDGRIRCRHLTVAALREMPWPKSM